MKKDIPLVEDQKKEKDLFEIKQALVGLELGPPDQVMLKYFDFLSGRIPVSAAYFMHVMPKLAPIDALFEKDEVNLIGEYSVQEEVEKKMIKKVENNLSNLEEIFVEFQISMGDPLDEILKTSQQLKTDIVVIGQKSEDSFHGILAKNLVRKTKSNALIIPDQSNYTLSNMLVPIDFSPNSMRALQTAVSINRQLKEKARIICLNIYEMPNVNMYRFSRTREQYKHIVEENLAGAFEAFINAYPAADRAYIDKALVQKDVPGTGKYIMNYALNHAVDFIIMGAKGHSKVQLLLMGSVTEKVVSLNKSIPVLVVK